MTPFLFIFISFFLIAHPAQAYVGPGIGLGAIGVFLGIVLSILLAVLGIIWYPFKRLIKKIKAQKKPNKENQAAWFTFILLSVALFLSKDLFF